MTGALSVSVLKVLSECSPDLGFSCCLITSCCLPLEVSNGDRFSQDQVGHHGVLRLKSAYEKRGHGQLRPQSGCYVFLARYHLSRHL